MSFAGVCFDVCLTVKRMRALATEFLFFLLNQRKIYLTANS